MDKLYYLNFESFVLLHVYNIKEYIQYINTLFILLCVVESLPPALDPAIAGEA